MDKLKRYLMCHDEDVEKLEAGLAALREENERLTKALDAHWRSERQGHTSPCTYGSLCPWCETDRLTAENARLLQDRLDYSNVKTTDGMNSSEWILRTGKAERERDALRNRYSTECPVCGGSGMAEEHNCPRCNGTGRVMMLEAEEVKARMETSEEAARKYGNSRGLIVGATYRIVLEGKR